MYRVKEIFQSIQGEGFFSGKKAIFLRFSGCNLWNGKEKDRFKAICKFCDTDFLGVNGPNGGVYNLRDLISKVLMMWNSAFSLEKKFIVLTGGEPLLQVDLALIKELKKKNFFIAIETNGTINTRLKFDWVTVSPKENSKWILKKGDELKIVYPQTKLDLRNALKLNFQYFFLQPKNDQNFRINFVKTINYCKSHRPWFPSLQLHKSLGIN